MSLTVDEIKERFPNPRAAGAGSGERTNCDYCIGGAFVIMANDGEKEPAALPKCFRFPVINDLAEMLEHHNPALQEERRPGDSWSQWYARCITSLNDDEEFRAAWDALGDALTHDKDQ